MFEARPFQANVIGFSANMINFKSTDFAITHTLTISVAIHK